MVGVIIPTFNSSATLSETLQSVEAQNHDIEIIIVDNISDDDTIKIAEDFKLKSKYSVKILKNENKNVGASRNIGLQHAKGNFILFLDSDDLLKPEALITLLNNIDNNDIIFGGWEDFDSKTGEILHVSNYDISIKENNFSKYFKFKPTVSTALIRKNALVEWKEDMFVWEVTQFFLDILIKGAKAIFIPNLVTSIRQQNNLNRLSIKYDHFEPINSIEFLIKNKTQLKNSSQLEASTEEIIDKEIISYCYSALKREYNKEKLKTLFKSVNIDLIPNYDNYKPLGVYHFILFFKGFKGLVYFSLLNKIFRRN